MGETYKLPIPLCNYQGLIERKVKPYYDVVLYTLGELEKKYTTERREFVADLSFIGEKTREKTRLSKINVLRTITAWIKTAGLGEDDFYVTTTSGGRRKYHLKVNEEVLTRLKTLL